VTISYLGLLQAIGIAVHLGELATINFMETLVYFTIGRLCIVKQHVDHVDVESMMLSPALWLNLISRVSETY